MKTFIFDVTYPIQIRMKICAYDRLSAQSRLTKIYGKGIRSNFIFIPRL